MIKLLYQCLHRNFIIILQVRGSYAKIVLLTQPPLKTVLTITWILWSSLLSVLNMFSCSATGTTPMIRASSPFINAALSVYRMLQITALVNSRCSNPQKNCEGLCGEPCQLPWGGEWSLRPTPCNPSGRTAMGKDLSLLIISCTSHQCRKRWIIPVNPFPWCREAMFVYIDQQHMWHSCYWRRLMLAEAYSYFPLAIVQLAGKTANCAHSTNQYKQWSSK